MKVLIVYGTTEGQTRKIAERMAVHVRQWGGTADLIDSAAGDDPQIIAYDVVMIAASLHQGRHQASVEEFVRRHVEAVNAKPSAFVSVSLAMAGDDADEHRDAAACATAFLEKTGWHPAVTHMVAGALHYAKYGFFKRLLMKAIARQKGAPVDDAKSFEFTDWTDLDAFVKAFLDQVPQKPA